MMNLLIKLKKNRKRVGRGGDRGGTSGKGNKGQKARSGGYVPEQFEGGQTPLTRRLPKRGFNNAEFRITYQIINLGSFARVDIKENIINKELLYSLGLIKSKRGRVKLLGTGDIVKAYTFEVDACSESAKAKIEAAGGQVVLK
jgi:large subunit ribosomal protein L15